MNHLYDDKKPDHLRERADAIEAKNEGAPLEVMTSQETWVSRGEYADEPLYDKCRYRRAPAPKMRPWASPADVPGPVCWLRNGITCSLILTLGEKGVWIYSDSIDWFELDAWEYSTDRITFHKCKVPA